MDWDMEQSDTMDSTPSQADQPEAPMIKSKPQQHLANVFLNAFLGMCLGGLLFFAGFQWSGHIAQNQQPDLNQPTVVQVQYQYPAILNTENPVVTAVQRVIPSVVGVSNYSMAGFRGQQQLREVGTGTGVIIKTDGTIVTNQHVINGASEIWVTLQDGTTLQATLVGSDPYTDLAILKVDAGKELPAAEWGDSDAVLPGEAAVAIGNPLGATFQNTVTAGIISATQRQVRISGSEYRYTYLQTDAAVNSGNSGGPLVNLNGEVIGINTAKIVDTSVEGISFAIPANTAKAVVDSIVESGKVVRAYIGIAVSDYAEITGKSADRGVYISRVTTGSPAETAGLREGDVIVGIESTPTHYAAQLFDWLLHAHPQDTATLHISRNSIKMDVTIILGQG